MNFDQISAKAESESGYLKDSNCIKVFIASQADDPAGREISNIFQDSIKNKNFNVNIISAGSFGYYEIEPIVLIEKPDHPYVLYKNLDLGMVPELIDDYLVNDNPRPDIAFCSIGPKKIKNIPGADDLPFFNLQNRIALRNCGYIDPENIDHYILRGGFSGLHKAMMMNQAEAIEKVELSGLRGRGGAGYPTAEKWKSLVNAKDEEKQIICNAADSDPAAFTARLLLSGDPYSVLEGILISAYAAGVSRCILFVDSEYKPAIKIINTALDSMREYGLLGTNILDLNFNCEIEIRESQISLVSGEETALLRVLENKQPMPYLRPPYPETKGVNGKPAIINYIETFADITAIFQYGPEKISGIGTEKSKGTKIITLTENGSAKYSIEIPFGISLQTIIVNYKNITDDTRNIKAIQFGGPTGAYFNDDLDIVIDYDTIKENSVIGSGTLEFIYDTECAVETALKKISYLHEQSCGKCVFCREGTFQMAGILEDISRGAGKPQDIDLLNEIGGQMKTGCICNFGRTAANPVLSTISLFRSEYDAHIKEKRCPAKGNDQ